MLSIIVDMDAEELEKIAEIVKKNHPNDEQMLFKDPLLAFQFAFQNEVKIAYVTGEMKRINGYELTKMLLTTQGHPQVIIIGMDEKGRKDALRVGASGFVVKPITTEKLLKSENMEW